MLIFSSTGTGTNGAWCRVVMLLYGQPDWPVTAHPTGHGSHGAWCQGVMLLYEQPDWPVTAHPTGHGSLGAWFQGVLLNIGNLTRQRLRTLPFMGRMVLR